MSADAISAAPTRRRWLHFSLRSLLIVVTLLCVVLGYWVSRSVRQRDAVKALAKVRPEVHIKYDYELDENYAWKTDKPPGPEWLRERLGIDFLSTVRKVEMVVTKDDDLRALKELPGLEMLVLNDSYRLTDQGLASISELTQLRRLTIVSGTFTGEGFAPLGRLKHLRSLTLHNTRELSPAGLAKIGKLTSLRELCLDGQERATNAGIAELGALATLEKLTLYFQDQVNDKVLEELKSLTALRELELVYMEQPGGDGLKHLASLHNLESLTLIGQLSDEAFSHLPELPKLKTARLHGCDRLTGAALANLGKTPNLTSLSLSMSGQLDEDGFAALPRLTRLSELEVAGEGPEGSIKFTDVGLKSIGQISSLRKLNLFGCGNLTDAGLVELLPLVNLEALTIDVDDLAQLSPKALAALQRGIPKCRIRYQQIVRGF